MSIPPQREVRRRWRAMMSTPVPRAVRWAVYATACAAYVGVLFMRNGPNPAELDARAVTVPTAAIAQGHLRQAAVATLVPNPPGYPLVTAPVVALLRPWFGATRWCDDKPIPSILRGPGAAYFRSVLSPCGSGRSGPSPFPHWYRSQAALVVLAWITLAAGAALLLRAAGAGGGVGELLLVGALSILPAASDAITQSFHPQDLMSTGLAAAGLAFLLRRRWGVAGLLLGAALVCKQFALLALLPALAAAPGWRARVRVVVPAGLVVLAVVAPFAVVDRVDTTRALSGVYVAGAGIVKTPTLLGSLAISEQLKLDLARNLPLVAAGALVLWAWWRAREELLTPLPLIGLTLSCMAIRLVFEVAMLDYYFLAVATFALILDFARGHPPWRSVGWILLTRFGLAPMLPTFPGTVSGILVLAAALAAVAMGLTTIPRGARRPAPVVGSRARATGVSALWVHQGSAVTVRSLFHDE